MADIVQFIPRANSKADRAFWKGPAASTFGDTDVGKAAVGEAFKVEDTAPSEMNTEEPKC